MLPLAEGASRRRYVVSLPGAATRETISPGHFAALVDARRGVTAFARIYRLRHAEAAVHVYFDALLELDQPIALAEIHLHASPGVHAHRMDWPVYEQALRTAAGIGPDQLTTLTGATPEEQAHLRDMLQAATMDDLLGPANGPTEDIVGMSVRDRYLVGKLAPREVLPPGDGADVHSELFDVEDTLPPDAVPKGLLPFGEVDSGGDKAARRHLPGEEFASGPDSRDPDAEANIETSAAANQSFVPSSIGLTVCIDARVEELEVEVRWGRYARNYDLDIVRQFVVKDRNTGQEVSREEKETVWSRTPAGGTVRLPIQEGRLRPVAADPDSPEVLLQGIIRSPQASGSRLITLFLVNDQVAPETNRDEAWVFQPEIIVCHPQRHPIFRRRPEPVVHETGFQEEAAMDMIYRRHLEFAVGHSISVHARIASNDPEHAVEVRTVVMPQHEVPATETPGDRAADRPAMRRMLDDGLLDMANLADLELPELIAGLSVLADDYAGWIEAQRTRIGKDVVGHDEAASAALSRCASVRQRLVEGIAVLEKDDVALAAFRFANRAMAQQRVHSIYALLRRRGGSPNLADLDIRKNRSWRPFQLAFLLMSIPALADPKHPDRTNAVDSIADLIWFPTGGGKTEAYLGVAAFTMGMRRMKPDLGGFDGSRGLSVVMRYTLRLLTLQQFQRAATLICAMELIRRKDEQVFGTTPFTIGLWVGAKLTPNSTEASHTAIEAERTGKRPADSTPAQFTSCPWCGANIQPGKHISVRRFNTGDGRTIIFCGDRNCDFQSASDGLPVLVVDEELYRRPPSLLIATVDKFALMAWKGAARTLFGRVSAECPRHGLLWEGAECNGLHPKKGSLAATKLRSIRSLRPPDLIIQDEFHLISGPLGTMVGLYETAVDDLCCWELDGKRVRAKVVASTATVRKATEQVNDVFLRKVSIFPPHGLDISDNYFSVQRPVEEKPGRLYMGICAPGSSRPAVLIRLYTALLTASQELFDHFGAAADPWMTLVGYFNSLRELGGMRRLAEDDVQTRCYRVQRSAVHRPGLAQRDVRIVDELTSRVSGKDIPKKLDQLEVGFNATFDADKGIWTTPWQRGETRAMDIVLATNMLSVGVDVNRIGLMAVNGQPKNTAEYIQATSRVGRAFPGLVCTVLTGSRPRDLSHYETFEHYHATFYRHVEAQSVTPFAPRALDRGLTGMMVSWLRASQDDYNANLGAGKMIATGQAEVAAVKEVSAGRALRVTDRSEVRHWTEKMVEQRCDEWSREANKVGRRLGYEGGQARAKGQDDVAALLKKPGLDAWGRFTVPTSLREVEPGARLIMFSDRLEDEPPWRTPAAPQRRDGDTQ